MLRHDFLPGYFDSSHDTKTDSLFLVNKYYFWINVMSHYEYDFMAKLPSLEDIALISIIFLHQFTSRRLISDHCTSNGCVIY